MKAIVLACQPLGCIGIKSLTEAGLQIQAAFIHRDCPAGFLHSDAVSKLAAQSRIPA